MNLPLVDQGEAPEGTRSHPGLQENARPWDFAQSVDAIEHRLRFAVLGYPVPPRGTLVSVRNGQAFAFGPETVAPESWILRLHHGARSCRRAKWA